MASWLKRGRRSGGQLAQQVVRHVCACGRASEVVRENQLQRLTCSTCGEVGILLPRDVYPGGGPIALSAPAATEPETARSGSPPTSRARRVNTPPVGRAKPAAAAEVPVSDHPQTVAPQPASPGTSAKAVADSVAGGESLEPLVTRRGIQAESALTPRRRRITSFRLVAVCMVLVVGVTGWWSVREFQLSSDAGQLGELMHNGLGSLDSGDFTTAARDLGKAADVLDRLGRDDSSAELIRQRSREAAAAAGLVEESLVEILDRAERLHRSATPAAWERQFERDHRGRWIVMQSILEPPDESVGQSGEGEEGSKPAAGPGAFEAEYPFTVEGRPVRLTGRLPALVRLSGWSDPGIEDSRPVIFAAQLEACRLDPESDTWWIQLSPETAFLWTDIGSIRHLGFLPDAVPGDTGISEILDRQATAVGLESVSITAERTPVESSADGTRIGDVQRETTR